MTVTETLSLAFVEATPQPLVDVDWPLLFPVPKLNSSDAAREPVPSWMVPPPPSTVEWPADGAVSQVAVAEPIPDA